MAPEAPLLNLPLELRQQIYSYLLTPAGPLTIRSLFIRDGYRNVFMSQQEKRLQLQIVRVCRQITLETLPVLYAMPLWKCGCRFEGLASQIGFANFGLIRRMEVDVDDLAIVSGMVGFNRQVRLREEGGCGGVQITSGLRRLSFDKLEELIVDGYHCLAVQTGCSRSLRMEARRLCELAGRIVREHPYLRVLVEKRGRGDWGSDARDLTFGRVRWRFLKGVARCEGDEVVIDPRIQLGIIESLIEADAEVVEKSSLPRWMDDGEFRQYPYLFTRAQAEMVT